MTRSWQRACAISAMVIFALVLLTHSKLRSADMDDPEFPVKTIRGEIKLEPPEFTFENADLIVSIEEISAQDAKAVRLAEKKFKDVSYDGRPESVLKFTMEGLRPNPKKRYKIRVLVDLDHNGRISKGDYRSTRPPYVFTGKDNDPLNITAQLLKRD